LVTTVETDLTTVEEAARSHRPTPHSPRECSAGHARGRRAASPRPAGAGGAFPPSDRCQPFCRLLLRRIGRDGRRGGHRRHRGG